MAQNLPFTYMPINDVRVAIGKCSASTLYERIKRNEFPPPDKVGSRSLWRSDVVAKWLEEQSQQAQTERVQRAKAARAKADQMVRARAA